MNVFRYTLEELPRVVLPLGKQGEDKATRIEVDVRPWLSEHPGASIALIVTMSNGTQYAGAVEVVDGIALWTITESDTILSGYGWAEWRMDCPGGDTYISRKGRTHLYPQAAGGSTGGNPYAAVVEQVLDAKRQVEALIPAEGTTGQVITKTDQGTAWMTPQGGGGTAAVFPATPDRLGVVKVGEGLKINGEGVLSVNAAEAVERDNTLPVTSAAVYTEVGNINALLATI